MHANEESNPDNEKVHGAPMVFSETYRKSALFLLMLIYVFNFVDRQVLNILAESIKKDMNLSDSQLGIVTGIAFALFYSILGIPIARLAETGNRPRLIALAITVWSSFTIACGFATNFAQLIIARLGVGIGEAGGVPPSHSLITEFTPKEKRAISLAFYSMGLPLGSFIGLGFGGLIADKFGWHMAFVIAGIPGIVLGVLALIILKEPRTLAKTKPVHKDNAWNTINELLRKKTFFWVVAGGALQAMVIYGFGGFIAPFFLRNHGTELTNIAHSLNMKPTGFLGLVLGVTLGLVAAAGTLSGGWLSDKFSKKSLENYMVVPAICALLSIPAFYAVFYTQSTMAALTLLILPAFLANTWYGPMHATCQGVVLPNQRATVSALILVIINLIGLGLGPPMVGFLSDFARVNLHYTSATGLKFALSILVLISAFSALAFLKARKTIDADTIS